MVNISYGTISREMQTGRSSRNMLTENYQIIHSPTYTYRQPHCAPSNIDIFFTNLPYSHSVSTLNELSSNHLPVLLTINTDSTHRQERPARYTNWSKYRQICNSSHINTQLKTPEDIDLQVRRLQREVTHAYSKATHPIRITIANNPDPYLQTLIRNRKIPKNWKSCSQAPS